MAIIDYRAITAVTGNGYCCLIKSIPKECGLYRCLISGESYSYMTDGGTEYDCHIWINNVEKIELPAL